MVYTVYFIVYLLIIIHPFIWSC